MKRLWARIGSFAVFTSAFVLLPLAALAAETRVYKLGDGHILFEVGTKPETYKPDDTVEFVVQLSSVQFSTTPDPQSKTPLIVAELKAEVMNDAGKSTFSMKPVGGLYTFTFKPGTRQYSILVTGTIYGAPVAASFVCGMPSAPAPPVNGNASATEVPLVFKQGNFNCATGAQLAAPAANPPTLPAAKSAPKAAPKSEFQAMEAMIARNTIVSFIGLGLGALSLIVALVLSILFWREVRV